MRDIDVIYRRKQVDLDITPEEEKALNDYFDEEDEKKKAAQLMFNIFGAVVFTGLSVIIFVTWYLN